MSSWESEMTPEEWESVQNKSEQYYEDLTKAHQKNIDDWFKTRANLLMGNRHHARYLVKSVLGKGSWE